MRPDRVLHVGPAGQPLRVLRPLLETTRADTLAYCAAHGLAYVDDPSNVDLRFTRNRVRHEVLPLLAQLNPAIREALRRTSSAAADLADLVERETERAWAQLARIAPGGVGLPAEGMRALPRPIQVALLARAAAALDPASAAALGARHLEAALDLLAADGAQREVHWPGGLRVQRVGPDLWLGARPQAPALPGDGYALVAPGALDLPGGARLTAALRAAPCAEALDVARHADLRRAVVGERLTVRGPQPGDRLRPPGLGGTKKVQDLLTDAKVPRPDRAAVPVVVGQAGPVWVVGYAVDERALAGPRADAPLASLAAQSVVCLRYEQTPRRLEEA
jgi:tRNA(Ile)-lysidine synthetase-like protein